MGNFIKNIILRNKLQNTYILRTNKFGKENGKHCSQKKLQTIFVKIFFLKTNWGKLIVVEIFFITDNVVIFFLKKSSLQILCDNYIFVKKFTCKKISKEINVRKIYVPKFFFWQKEFISLTITPRNFSNTNSQNKFIVKKSLSQ